MSEISEVRALITNARAPLADIMTKLSPSPTSRSFQKFFGILDDIDVRLGRIETESERRPQPLPGQQAPSKIEDLLQ